MSDFDGVPRNPRAYLLPDRLREAPSIEAWVNAFDDLLKEYVDEPSLLFLDLRDVHRDKEQVILHRTAEMLGITKQSAYLNNDMVRKMISHLPQYRGEHTTEAYQRLIGFLVNYPMGFDYLWTEDYFGMFSVPHGDLLVDDLGVEKEDQSRGWYNTTHVLIRARPRAIFPDAKDPYYELTQLFNSLAPAYLVLEFIGNILPPYESTLDLGVGVVDGFATETYSFMYEQANLSTSDWSEGRKLPAPNLSFHGQSQIEQGTVLITGGYSGNLRNENLSFYIKRSSSAFRTIKSIPFNESEVTAIAYAPSITALVAGTSKGEMAYSPDGGDTWVKIYSPWFDKAVPIVGIVWADEYGVFMAAGKDGTTSITQEPKSWTGGLVSTPGPINGLLFASGTYVALSTKAAVYTSLNGSTWGTQAVTASGPSDALLCGTFDRQKNQWLVAGECGRVFLSLDLQDWTEINPGFGNTTIRSCDYAEDRGLYIICGDNAYVGASADARIWFLVEPHLRTENAVFCTYSPGHDRFMVWGERGTFSQSQDIYNWNLYPNTVLDEKGEPVPALCRVWIREGGRTVVGGRRATVSLSLIEERYIQGPTLPYRVARHAQVGVNQTALIVGGQSGTSVFNQTYMLDRVNNAWVMRADYPIPVKEASAALIPQRSTGEVWTPRNSRFGTESIWTATYLPHYNYYLAAGGRGFLSQSQYGLNWGLVSSPFNAHHIVGAVYGSDRSLTIAANSMPAGSVSYSAANLLTDQLVWGGQAPPGIPGERVNDFTSVTAGNAQILLTCAFDGSKTSLVEGEEPEPGKRSFVPVVSAGGELEFDIPATPARTSRLSQSVFSGTYSTKYRTYLLGALGGVFVTSDPDGEGNKPAYQQSWKFTPVVDPSDQALALVDEQLPVVAVAEGEGLLYAVNAAGRVFLSYDAGVTWDRGTWNDTVVLDTGVFDHESWIAIPTIDTLDASFDMTWMPGVNLMLVADATSARMLFPTGDSFDGTQTVNYADLTTSSTREINTRRLSTFDVMAGGPIGSVVGNTTVTVYLQGTSMLLYNALATSNPMVSPTGGYTLALETSPAFPERGLVCATSFPIYGSSGLTTNRPVLFGGSWLWSMYSASQLTSGRLRQVPVNIKMLADNPTWSFVAGDLKKGAVRYAVTAFDDYGDGTPSYVSVEVPDSTEGVGISLTWKPLKGARGYHVWGRTSSGMQLMATLPPNDTNYVDEGKPFSSEQTLPTSNTSGLSLFENELGDGMGLEIVDIRYVKTLGCVVLATKTGRIAVSYEGVNWFGVVNPAIQLDCGRIVIRETESCLLSALHSGSLYIYPPGATPIVHTPSGVGALNTICYDPDQQVAVVGSEGPNVLVSKDARAATPFQIGISLIAVPVHPSVALHSGKHAVVVVGTDDSGALTTSVSPPQTVQPLTPSDYCGMMVTAAPADPRITRYHVYDMGTWDSDLGGDSSNPNRAGYYGWFAANPATAVHASTFNGVAGVEFTSDSDFTDVAVDSSGAETSGRFASVQVDVVADGMGGQSVEVRVDGVFSSSEPFVAGYSFTVLGYVLTLGASYTDGSRATLLVRTTSVSNMTKGAWRFPGSGKNTSYNPIGVAWTTVDTNVTGFNANNISLWKPVNQTPRWLAVGNGGFIGYSQDNGATWEASSAHALAVGPTNLTCAASASVGSNYVTMLGGEDGYLAVTPNVFTVPPYRISGHNVAGHVNDIRWAASMFVIVGENGGLNTSIDGSSIRPVFTDSTASFNRVVPGEDKLAVTVVGDYGTLYTSADGRAWTKREAPVTSGAIYTLTASPSNGRVVVAGQGSRVSITSSIPAWQQVGLANITGRMPLANIRCSIYCPMVQRFFLFGDNGYVYQSNAAFNGFEQVVANLPVISTDTSYSYYEDILCAATDGTGWVMLGTRMGRVYVFRTNNPAIWATYSIPGVSIINAIAHNAGVWMVASNDGKIRKSTNTGATWTGKDVPFVPYTFRRAGQVGEQRIDFTGITFGGGVWVAVGDEGDICISTDAGDNWHLRDSKLNGSPLSAVAYGGQTFVAVGGSGGLRTSFTGFEPRVLVCGGTNTHNGSARADTNLYDWNANTWTAANDMVTERRNHGTATFDDGTVLAVGGTGSDDSPLISSERWLPHRGIWVADMDMPYAKGYVRAVGTDSGAVIATGAGPDPTHSALVYLPTLVPPSAPLLTAGLGFLAPGTYYYRISATTVSGETLPTKPVHIVLTEASGVVIDWEPVDNVVEYKIYGRDAAASELIQSVPGHLTSFNDLGVATTVSSTFVRKDNSKTEWFEVEGELPLPREGHGFSPISKGMMMVTGGYQDGRVWRYTVNPYNFVRSLKWEYMLDPESSYVVYGYVDNGDPVDQIDNYVTPNV